ncbi:berberine bridge enzyme-like 28 [Momordica charantia]|uniref:Berberine bridge enzyme-like 28 n=1 Tax=Momordica charantia TaxID=3673 RepID=A0A6J1DFZ4_MOMCH|nr:berberine bridge enzyme-like 28 [Momordica charantia]
MKYSSPLIPLSFSLAFVLLSSSPTWAHKHEVTLPCISDHSQDSYPISKVVYSPMDSTYFSVLNFSIRNPRFSTIDTPKPLLIITPANISHIQAAVICSKTHGLEIRIRSGGHDYEGLSYISHLPFIIVDLINLRSITIDVKHETAWVQSGATLGEFYYRIAEKSRTLAFPAGLCPTVGVGGHFSGGGYGLMMRKYGLAADNVIDAYLIDANGKFHDRESMGEDLFWAIRGGAGGSFGIVVAWKVKLVPVPATVTSCSINRTLEKDAVKLIHRWQYVAHKLDENLFLGTILSGGVLNVSQGGGETNKNPIALFFTLFLGKVDELVKILKTNFPELVLAKEDCIESSWIESALVNAKLTGFPADESLETLLKRDPLTKASMKIKSDYVKEPISETAIEGIWERLKTQDKQGKVFIFMPYGGIMSQIPESETPYAHRARYLYKIGYIIQWEEKGVDAEKIHLD